MKPTRKKIIRTGRPSDDSKGPKYALPVFCTSVRSTTRRRLHCWTGPPPAKPQRYTSPKNCRLLNLFDYQEFAQLRPMLPFFSTRPVSRPTEESPKATGQPSVHRIETIYLVRLWNNLDAAPRIFGGSECWVQSCASGAEQCCLGLGLFAVVRLHHP